VLDDMDVNTRTQPADHGFPFRPLDNLPHGEIAPVRMLAVEQGSGEPDFVRN
jgi:hypothetical protein